ncbi:uncharacterized protein LOC143775363 isoform X2 [Ranitomeya variabilis]|uniref:uncharacterized protein LOC143775363 isoform X2 n=1 Tax=Ranitomeya variabilis TaxID=490064 RepID=UPI00405757DE
MDQTIKIELEAIGSSEPMAHVERKGGHIIGATCAAAHGSRRSLLVQMPPSLLTMNNERTGLHKRFLRSPTYPVKIVHANRKEE